MTVLAILAAAAARAAAALTVLNRRISARKVIVVRDRFSAEVSGRGPDLLFIPGLSSSRETWRATAERLKGRYRLHLIQVAGFAGEPARANAGGDVVLPTAEAIAAYIAECGPPITVVGHSLGGTIGLYLAQNYPQRIRKLLIVDAFPFIGVVYDGPDATPDSMRAMIESWRSGATPWSREQQEAMFAEMVTAPEHVETIKAWSRASDPSVTMRALFEDMVLDMRPGLAGLAVPIAVLFPDYVSPGLPPDATQIARETAYAPVPRKSVRIVAQSRHFIMLDQPEAFAEALDSFLAD